MALLPTTQAIAMHLHVATICTIGIMPLAFRIIVARLEAASRTIDASKVPSLFPLLPCKACCQL